MDYVHEEADVYGRCTTCRHIHKSERCIEEQIKGTMQAIEASAKEAHAENPQVSEDDAYHDIAQSLMTFCLPEVAGEVARRTGVPQLGVVRTDDEEEPWWVSLD